MIAVTACAAVLTSAKNAAAVAVRTGRGMQPHGRADDDPEGALGAGEQPDEVVAGDALDGVAADVHEGAVGEDDIEREHVIAGHTVLRAAQTSGVGGDVAADRRDADAPGIGRVHEAVSGCRGIELRGDHTRLHPRELLVRIEVEDPVEAGEVEDDGAFEPDSGPGEPGSRAPGDDGGARGVRPGEELLHLGDRGGPEDGPRGDRARPSRPVRRDGAEGRGIRLQIDQAGQRAHARARSASSDPDANSGGRGSAPGAPCRAASSPSSRATAAFSGAAMPCDARGRRSHR